MGQTTIGTGFDKHGKIIIGKNVRVGAGAKIISSDGLKIADNVDIGANAVVCKNILEAGSVYGGIPAKLIKYK
jgi:serine acetyltransferase